MNAETIRLYCLDKQEVTEGFPFDEVTLVFKVAGKMFALMSLDGDLRINLKRDPDKAIELRMHHNAIKPGYHMNKQHWNTVYIDGSLSEDFVHELIDLSYDLIVSKLPLKDRKRFLP